MRCQWNRKSSQDNGLLLLNEGQGKADVDSEQRSLFLKAQDTDPVVVVTLLN